MAHVANRSGVKLLATLRIKGGFSETQSMSSDLADRPSRRAAYYDLFQKLSEATFILDIQTFRVLDANLAAEHLTGIDTSDLVGRDVLEFVPDTERLSVQKSLRVARRRNTPYRFETRWTGSSAPKQTAWQACVLKLVDGLEVVQAVISDVTELVESRRREAEYLAKLEALSTTDEMTKISNFRSLMSEARAEHDRSFRYQTPFSIVFIDVDHFKHYNDRNGHPAGDAVLEELARVLKAQSRTTDLVARYGGEEFAVLCRGVPTNGAAVLAERIRKAVEDHTFAFGDAQPLGRLTVSVGVAGFPADGPALDDVFEKADQALYESKRLGRNRVTLYSPQIRTKPKARKAA